MEKSHLLSRQKLGDIINCLEKYVPQDCITTYFDSTGVSILISATNLIAIKVRFSYLEINTTRNVKRLVLTKISDRLRKYMPAYHTDKVFTEYIELTRYAKSHFTDLANTIDMLLYLEP